ncbi:MAG: phosphatidylinositol kinase [Actinomycetes bacterium]
MEKAASPPRLDLVSIDGLLPGASNATLLARDGEGRPWVYKPERGERPLWDFPHGTLARREVACYRLSESLGLGVVPETVLADGPFGPGSAQRFLEEDLEWDPRPLIVAADPSLWPIALLDVLANNADRKIGHLLRQPNDTRIWAIDNGLTFHADDKLRTVLWSFAGQRIPDDLVRRIDPAAIEAAISGLLTPAEVARTVQRALALVENPVHPPPPHDRPPMPWPLW